MLEWSGSEGDGREKVFLFLLFTPSFLSFPLPPSSFLILSFFPSSSLQLSYSLSLSSATPLYFLSPSILLFSFPPTSFLLISFPFSLSLPPYLLVLFQCSLSSPSLNLSFSLIQPSPIFLLPIFLSYLQLPLFLKVTPPSLPLFLHIFCLALPLCFLTSFSFFLSPLFRSLSYPLLFLPSLFYFSPSSLLLSISLFHFPPILSLFLSHSPPVSHKLPFFLYFSTHSLP